jgi:hypothetical protein
MPTSSRLLYYDLAMRADDDGFINSPRKIARMTGASDDDLKVLATKKFIIMFPSGVVAIKHWKIHNYIRKDTYSETAYKEEKSMLELDENKSYRLKENARQRTVDESSTQDRIGKDSIGNIINIPASEDKSSAALSVKASKHKYGKYKNVLLKDEELQKLKEEYKNWEKLINYLDEYIERKGYKAKSHYLCIKKWVVNAVKQELTNTKQNQRTYNNDYLCSFYANQSEVLK